MVGKEVANLRRDAPANDSGNYRRHACEEGIEDLRVEESQIEPHVQESEEDGQVVRREDAVGRIMRAIESRFSNLSGGPKEDLELR